MRVTDEKLEFDNKALSTSQHQELHSLHENLAEIPNYSQFPALFHRTPPVSPGPQQLPVPTTPGQNRVCTQSSEPRGCSMLGFISRDILIFWGFLDWPLIFVLLNTSYPWLHSKGEKERRQQAGFSELGNTSGYDSEKNSYKKKSSSFKCSYASFLM